MTSDFAPEVAKYPKSSYFGSVRACCFALLAMQLVDCELLAISVELFCVIVCSVNRLIVLLLNMHNSFVVVNTAAMVLKMTIAAVSQACHRCR